MITQFVYPPQHAGEFELFVLEGTGPASYASAGDPIVNPGVGEHIYAPIGAVSLSGTYYVVPQPASAGVLGVVWSWIWFVVATGVPVAAATNLSAETVQFGAIGGQL